MARLSSRTASSQRSFFFPSAFIPSENSVVAFFRYSLSWLIESREVLIIEFRSVGAANPTFFLLVTGHWPLTPAFRYSSPRLFFRYGRYSSPLFSVPMRRIPLSCSDIASDSLLLTPDSFCAASSPIFMIFIISPVKFFAFPDTSIELLK